jgi:hypothetical protein
MSMSSRMQEYWFVLSTGLLFALTNGLPFASGKLCAA